MKLKHYYYLKTKVEITLSNGEKKSIAKNYFVLEVDIEGSNKPLIIPVRPLYKDDYKVFEKVATKVFKDK